MKLAVRTTPGSGHTPTINYSWDEETGILAARISEPDSAQVHECAMTDAVASITTADSAFMHFEISSGRVSAFEIAMWPSLSASRSLQLPDVDDGYVEARLAFGDRELKDGALVGFTALVEAIPDIPAKVLQLRFGSARVDRIFRIADAFLIGVDRQKNLASLWLTRMPGFGESLEQQELRAMVEFNQLPGGPGPNVDQTAGWD